MSNRVVKAFVTEQEWRPRGEEHAAAASGGAAAPQGGSRDWDV